MEDGERGVVRRVGGPKDWEVRVFSLLPCQALNQCYSARI